MSQFILEQSFYIRFAILITALLFVVFGVMAVVTYKLNYDEKQRKEYNKAMREVKTPSPELPPIDYPQQDPFRTMTAERWAQSLMQAAMNKPAEASIEEFKLLQKGRSDGR